jgi:hypothetical protein
MSITEHAMAAETTPEMAPEMAPDEELRHLHDEHQYFERRLEQLHLQGALSVEEELEAKSIKRQKLWLKDRMAAIRSQQVQASA